MKNDSDRILCRDNNLLIAFFKRSVDRRPRGIRTNRHRVYDGHIILKRLGFESPGTGEPKLGYGDRAGLDVVFQPVEFSLMGGAGNSGDALLNPNYFLNVKTGSIF